MKVYLNIFTYGFIDESTIKYFYLKLNEPNL